MEVQDEPWYREGLAFECTRCGACCTGAPGYVWVEDEEIARLAAFRGESFEAFCLTYVRQVADRFSLIERPGGDCVFWDKASGCTVYSARPNQCQTWPFWDENIETTADWRRVQRGCPGAGTGRVYTVEEIRVSVARVDL